MGSNPSNFKGSNNPVEDVSWKDCQSFIIRLNSLTGKKFRLPTEAEWEFAARGGNKSQGYQYSGSNVIDEVAWYDENSSNQTHPVKSAKPNELGIYDMSGNVWEWCQDWFAGNYYKKHKKNPLPNPAGPSGGSIPAGPSGGSIRVIRGGSWGIIARDCRVANRDNYTPDITSIYIGLRLALSE